MKTKSKCIMCKKKIVGRTDKRYCSLNCKNAYHNSLRSVTKHNCNRIDAYLHRNRSILLEVMGKNNKQRKIEKTVLDKKGFKYEYLTGIYQNAHGKQYHIVYDFAWMKFSNGELLIIRRS